MGIGAGAFARRPVLSGSSCARSPRCARLDEIAVGTGRLLELEEHREQIRQRLETIEATALRARAADGGVLIW
ncbi:hypothetical protein [Streptomyces sp. NPDC002619]|uniref:hypothetical protein n=1 Tax=Streptomyces sp. NPDC002619 TaxID=3364655 RepID=UPI003679099B